jgi:small subunit ribosomal protein S7
MPRRAAAQVRTIDPDALHSSKLVQQVINKVMVDGKKSLAEKIVYEALDILAQRSGRGPVDALEESVKALTPVLEVRSRRVGGATYQVPVEVPPRRARTLAVRWLTEFARNRREKTMAERLAGELLDAQNQQGGAFKRKDDIYRMAQANKDARRSRRAGAAGHGHRPDLQPLPVRDRVEPAPAPGRGGLRGPGGALPGGELE